MQVANNVSGLPTTDVTQLVSDAANAPSGEGVFLSADEASGLLAEIQRIAQYGKPPMTQFLQWSNDNYDWNTQQHTVTSYYPNVHNLYVALGGTDTYTVNGEYNGV